MLVVIGLYLACAVVAYWHAWPDPTSRVVAPNASDPERMIWFLAWIPFSLIHAQDPLLTTWANAPYGVNVLADTSQPLLGLMAAPVTMLFGPIASFNALLTLAFVASATAGYALSRRFTTWRPAAFVGGLVYGFSPYMVGQGAVGHLNLVFVPLPPLIFLVIHDLVVRQRGRPALLGCALGLLLVAQIFISTEILAGSVIVAVGAICVLAILNWRSVHDKLQFAAVGLGVAAVLSAALLAYPVWFTLEGPQHIVGPIQAHPQQFRSDLVAPLVADSLQKLAPAWLGRIRARFDSGNIAEDGSYLGGPLLVVLTIGVVILWRRRIVRLAAIMALIAFVLSLGARLVVLGTPDIDAASGRLIPEAIFGHVPLLKNSQPSRFSLYATLFVSVLLAVILDELWHRLRRRPWRTPRARRVFTDAACALVSLIALAPLLPAWPYAIGAAATPRTSPPTA